MTITTRRRRNGKRQQTGITRTLFATGPAAACWHEKFLDVSITTRDNQNEARLIEWSISLKQNRNGRKRVSNSREIYKGEGSLSA